MPANHAAVDREPSMLARLMVWLWRLTNTALLAAGVWVLWRQSLQLEALNGSLLDLLDYLGVIAERLG
jgi:hypothetical protein